MKHFIALFLALIISGSYLLFKNPAEKKSSSTSKPTRSIANSEYCFLCQFKPLNYPNANSQKTCDDLFASACSSPNPMDDITADSEEAQQEAIRQRQDNAAKAMGFKNFDDGLKKRLAERGIRINPNTDPELWDMVRNSLLRPASHGTLRASQIPASDAFAGAQNCNSLVGYTPPPASAAEEQRALESTRARLAQYQESTQTNLINYYSQNIPFFMEDNISTICQQYNHTPPGMFAADENSRQEQHCSNLERIRREAVLLYREEGSSGYTERAREFVSRYLLPPLQHSLAPQNIPNNTGDVEDGPSNLPYSEIMRTNSFTYQLCEQNSNALVALAQNVAQEYAQEVNSSRTHVQQTIAAVYGTNRQNRAQQVLDTLRADIQAFVPQITNDPNKQSRIIEGYNNVELYWLEQPPASAYTTNSNGVQVLSDTVDNSNSEDRVQNIFSDPSLSFFTNPNAYYSPQVIAGAEHRAEHINFYPPYLALLETNPYAFSSIMAHELGHKIGPKLSALNGHDLKQEYSELLQCYRDRKSIRMANGQEDEVIADYISSEIMAQQVARLPASQRRSAFMAMASTFCDDGGHAPVNCTGTHPEGIFRVNGILAGNPNVRRVMGCNEEPPNFKNCSLSTAVSINSDSSSPSPTRNERQEAEDARGVQ